MDKKDDNKKPSKKDKKKDKKDKKDKKKKVIKKKSDDKISQSQIVNIKIGDISKPKTRSRRKAAPKAAPPPPQIQRQLQYLPSLAAQAPMIPPPLAPAPTPPPAAPAPPRPRPPAPAAEPRRTGDFFSDASKFGTSYDLSSASLDDLTSVGRGASRPSMTRAFNRPRSDSGVSALTDPTYADFDNFSDFNATAPSRFGSSYDLQTTAPPQNVELLGQFSDRTQGAETQDSVIRKLAYDYDMPFVENLEDFDLKEPRLRLQGVTQSSEEEEEQIMRKVRPMKDDDSVATQFGFNLSQSTQPEESLGVGADFENIAAPSVVNVSDNLGFVSSQQPQEIQELQPTQAPTEAQPIEAQLVQEPVVAVPISEDPMISEPLQEQAVKGDVKPEDEPTGGGGKKESIIFSELSDKKLSKLFKIFENERFQMQLTQADAIERYNLRTKKGKLISTKQFSLAYTKYKKQLEAAAEE